MEPYKTAIERAFDLAKSGQFATLGELIKRLREEGYSRYEFSGPSLRRQLSELIRESR